MRNNDAKAHTYQVHVQFGSLGQDSVTLSQVAAGQTEEQDVSVPAGSNAPRSGAIPCTITRVVDETGKTVTEGPPIPPPPDVPPPEPAPTTSQAPLTSEPPTTTRPVPTTEAPSTKAPTTEPLTTPPDLEPT